MVVIGIIVVLVLKLVLLNRGLRLPVFLSTYIMSDNLKFTKLNLQAAYYRAEYKYIKELCEKSEQDLRRFIKEQHPDQYDIIFSSPKKTNKETEKDEKEDVNSTEKPKNKDLKKLYRKIAEKTHPDKTGTDDNADLFSAAAKAYKDHNIAEMLDIASKLNIELPNPSIETILLLEENITAMDASVNHMKESIAWHWEQTKADPMARNTLLGLIAHQKGIILT